MSNINFYDSDNGLIRENPKYVVIFTHSWGAYSRGYYLFKNMPTKENLLKLSDIIHRDPKNRPVFDKREAFKKLIEGCDLLNKLKLGCCEGIVFDGNGYDIEIYELNEIKYGVNFDKDGNGWYQTKIV